MELLIFALLALPLVMLAMFTFVFMKRWLYHYDADRTAARLRRQTTYRYDPLGNPEVFYNPKTGGYFVPPTGNPAFPIQRQYLMNNGVPKALENEPDRTILVNAPNARVITGVPVVNAEQVREQYYGKPGEPVNVEDEPLDELPAASEPQQLEGIEPKQLEGARTLRTFTENVNLLAEYKRKGRGKEESIKEVTGLRSKGGNTFREYVKAWDELPAF